MPALPTPLVRLRAVDGRGALYAKLESLHPSGSVYDRVAGRVIARAAAAGRPVLVHGDALWCLALFGAAARAGVEVAAFVVAEPVVAEHLVLLRDTGVAVVRAPRDEGASVARAEAEAAARSAALVPLDASADFTGTLAIELVQQIAGLPGPVRVIAPDDAHGLLAGLRAGGLDAHGVRAAPGAAALVGLRSGAEGLDDGAARAARARASRSHGLLVGHTSAAVLAVAEPVDAPTVVALVVDAGDRVFSQDEVSA